MREEILPVLACPICRSDLNFKGERAKRRLEMGTLTCEENSHKFPVSGGIAILKPQANVGERKWNEELSEAQQYEELDQAYRRSLMPDVERAVDETGSIISKEAAFHRGPIIDIATGRGTLLRTLAAHLPAELLIMGTDIDEAVLRGTRDALVRRQSYSNCSLIATDARCMSFKNCITDCCVSYHGYSNVPQTAKAFAETARILQPKGTLIFSTLFVEEDSQSFEKAKTLGYGDVITEDRLRSTLDRAGFGISSIDELVSGKWPGNPYDTLPLKNDHFAMAVITAIRRRA